MKPSLRALLTVLSLVAVTSIADADVRYVDPQAPGTQTGLDWANAFPDLQPALAAAAADPTVTEVRVAGNEGYRPTMETVPGDPRSACFVVPDGLTLRGGYAGHGATDPDFRSTDLLHRSFLSGDLALNDFGTTCTGDYFGQADNAYHLVDLSGTGSATVLDGFTVVHGVADGPTPHDSGGGIYMHESDARVRDCSFFANYALTSGGAIYRLGGAPRFEDCMFSENDAGGDGGAIWSFGSWDLLITRCAFWDSTAGGDGGAVCNTGGETEIVNSEFWDNVAGGRGGAVAASTPEVRVLGSSFSRCNAADCGGVWGAGGVEIGNCVLEAVWGTGDSGADNYFQSDTAELNVRYTCVREFLFPGPGNIDDAPLFVDASWLTCEPDLSLQPGSPCIDAGENAPVQQFGLTDLRGAPRFQDDPQTPDTGAGTAPIIDLGAYELTPAVLGEPYCFGDGSSPASCPCGNSSAAGEGCRHSGGMGMVIRATGTASISADDLTIVVEQVPPGNAGLIYSGTIALPVPNVIWDGLQCTLGDTRRYQPQFQTDGVFTDTGFVAQDPTGDYFLAGVEYHFQLWTRDAAGGPSPCGTGANYSPTYRVLMGP